MQTDSHWCQYLLDYDYSGIDRIDDFSLHLRMVLTTTLGDQWMVAREYRRQIKLRFNAEGIEFAVPERSVEFRG